MRYNNHTVKYIALFLPLCVLMSCSSREYPSLPYQSFLLVDGCDFYHAYDNINDSDQPVPWCLTPPVYPQDARKNKIEGHVTLEFSVGRDGAAYEIVVIESEPKGIFDQAAIDSIKRSFYIQSDRECHEVRRQFTFVMPKEPWE